MTAQIFLAVICLLALKYTLELAGRTGSRRRRSRTPETFADASRRRARALPRRWAWIISLGVVLVSIGWVSDRAAAPAILIAGVAITQAGVFLAGVRWARRPRRTAAKAARAARRPENLAAAPRPQQLSTARS